MRILFLNPAARTGGAETALLEVVRSLVGSRPSWQIEVITASDGPLVRKARALGAEVRVLPFPRSVATVGEWTDRHRRWPPLRLWAGAARAAWPAWRYLVLLRSTVRDIAPDIVHTNGLKMHVLGAWARPAGTPLVWHLHDYVSRRPVSARLLTHLARACSALVAPSQSVASDVRKLRGTPPPIHVIGNAVDLERFRPDGDRCDLDDRSELRAPAAGVVRVGLVATFARWKGHRLFLEAIARLPSTLNIRAYVIGGAVYDAPSSQVSLDELRQAAARLGIEDRIVFTGIVDDPAPVIRALDIVVHASTDPEPFGLAIAEALASGRATIVSAAGGAAELVTPGIDALTFAPNDVDGLAGAIERLAADPALRERLGGAARLTAERRFTRGRVSSDLVEIYERLAGRAPLRVLHVHSGNLYGGVETFLTTLARNAAIAPRMTSEFALCFEGRLSDELRALGHPPRVLGKVRLSRPPTVWRARWALASLLASQHVDVVVCHQAWPYAIFGPTIRRAGVPLVFWLHTGGNGRHWLERWARRVRPDLAVANSRFTTAQLARWFPRAPVETIHYPLALDATRAHDGARLEIRRALHTANDDRVIVQVGRLEATKGVAEALHALARLRDVSGWTYWIVGGAQRASDEHYRRELEHVARRHGIRERVRFAGERLDVAAILGAADIYLQPNIRPEAFGISLVEAQAAGLPIVTSAIGGALEIVDDTCGSLVAPGDIDGLAAALRQLLADTEMRARLGRAARDRSAALCDLTRQMQRVHEVLSSSARS